MKTSPEFIDVCIGLVLAPVIYAALLLGIILYFPTLGWSLYIANKFATKFIPNW